MSEPIFTSVEQLGETLVEFWFKSLTDELPPGKELSRLLATGDDVEMCLSHLEWTCEGNDQAVFLGFPDIDVNSQAVSFPESIDDCNECKLVLNLAASMARIIGISANHDDLMESQLTDDLVYMLKRAIDFEMLLAINEVRKKLELYGVTFTKDADIGIYRHEDYGSTKLDTLISDPGKLEFSTKKIPEPDVLDMTANAFYRSDIRKQWFKKARLRVVECDL